MTKKIVRASAVASATKKSPKITSADAAKHARPLIADPKKDGIPLALQTQNRAPSLLSKIAAEGVTAQTKSEAKSYNLPKSITPEGLAMLAERDQKQRTKSQVRIDKMKAKANGATTAMPLTGKAALAVIAGTAIANGHKITKIPFGKTTLSTAPTAETSDRSPGMKRLRESGKAAEIAAKTVAENNAATKAKPAAKSTAKPAAKSAKGKKSSGSSWYKEADGTRAVQMMKRKNGATSAEMQKELKWQSIIVRRFVRDIVRGKMKMRTETDRSGGETRYTIIT